MQRVGTPDVTRVCQWPVDGLSFPLKKDYERVNRELFDPAIVNEDWDPERDANEHVGLQIDKQDNIVDVVEESME